LKKEMDGFVDDRFGALGIGSDRTQQPLTMTFERVEDTLRLDNRTGLARLADDTGGFLVEQSNDLSAAFRRIDEDNQFHYLLTYSPINTTFDGKYRSIGLKVSRPGMNVRSRRGYLAIVPAALVTTGAAVPPKRVSEEPRAEADFSEGVGRKEEVSASEVLRTLPSEPMPAVPAHAEATKLIEDLKSASARIRPSPGSGETASAVNGAAERGWAAYEKGDVESAAKELGTAATAPDARPWVVYALGLSQFALRQQKDAALSWERVRHEVPEFEPVYFNLADAYGLQQNETAALKVLRDAETRWPKDAEVANAIGVIHVRRGSLDAAVESFERATRVQPEDALGYFNLARTCQMRMRKSQRYDRQTEKWIGGEEDRRRAVAAFEQYLKIGGPYERQAKEALASLAWK